MKRFLTLTLTALLIVTVTSLSLLAFNTTAAENTGNANPSNVIFVSDNNTAGDGSGRDADNPLRPVDVDEHFLDVGVSGSVTYGRYYLRSALYQAAEKLVNTGGTIVICGPVLLDENNTYGSSESNKDFYFPESDHELVITSEYGGVDYAETNGAYFKLKTPAHVGLGAPTVVKNITLRTEGTSRIIAARGNRLVMGEGIECINDDGMAATSGNHTYYPYVVGGTRHNTVPGGTDLTVISGTYGYLSGGSWGTPQKKTVTDATGASVEYNHMFDTISGDINLKLLGGECLYQVRVMAISGYNVLVDGDVNVTVDGSFKFNEPLMLTQRSSSLTGAFMRDDCCVNLKIKGCVFAGSASIEVENRFSGIPTIFNEETQMTEHYPLYAPAKITVDLSEADITSEVSGKDANAIYNDTITKFQSKGEVLYPVSWLSSVTCDGQNGTVKPVIPEGTVVNGAFKPVGTVLSATFNNPVTGKTHTQLVKYDEQNGAFSLAFDLNYDSDGTIKKLVKYKYGTGQYQSAFFETYAEAPEVKLLGARLRTAGNNQGLRFVAEYNLPENVTVGKTGVLAIKAYMLDDLSELNLDEVFGSVKLDVVNAYEYEGNMRFECELGSVNLRELLEDYVARAYVKYTVNGVSYVAYSDVIERNPYLMAKAATDGETEESDETVSYLKSSFISKSDSFSIYNQYVSDEELEALQRRTVDYMELMANVEWTPAKSFAMYNNLNDEGINDVRQPTPGGSYVMGVGMTGVFEAGKTYYGMPYTSSSTAVMQTSNYESFRDLMTLTYPRITEYKGEKVPSTAWAWILGGRSSLASWMYYNLTDEEKDAAYTNYTIVPGSHCSKSVISAWNLVTNNTETGGRLLATYRFVPGSNSNVIPVGNYVYKNITEESNTQQIIENNGVVFNTDSEGKIQSINYDESDLSVMYASFDALRPGDAVIHYTDSGHTRLVVSVDKANRIVTTLECANWTAPFLRMSDPQSAKAGVNLANVYNNNSCWKVRKYSYDNLLITSYIPSRLVELQTGLVDELAVIMTDTDIADGVLNGTVKSNMQIVSLDVTVTGNGVNKHETIYLTSEAMHLAEYDITKLDLTTRFGLTAGSTYSITLEVGTPGYVSAYEDNSARPNDVDGDKRIATGYTPTFTPVWENMTFVAPAPLSAA